MVAELQPCLQAHWKLAFHRAHVILQEGEQKAQEVAVDLRRVEVRAPKLDGALHLRDGLLRCARSPGPEHCAGSGGPIVFEGALAGS